MRRQRAELAVVTLMALLLTVIVAAPVVLAPSQRLFGLEEVGRHHDPFTVIRQFEHLGAPGVYAQPLTDMAGAALARVMGGIAAYNWLILVTFPFAAVAAFALARHLELSFASATFAALAFAFSPFHFAQAAYHPHIAQVQWIPLYFLALWRGLDRASPASMAMLVLATAAVTFSNFYGGLIAAVMTPFAIAAYWLARTRGTPGAARRVIITVSTLVAIALCGVLYVWWRAPALWHTPSAFAVAASDPFKYSAKWWSYLVFPVANPWLGNMARSVWDAADVHEGLLEQQVTIGGGIVMLGVAGSVAWLIGRARRTTRWAAPMLASLAVIALLWSLSPERTVSGIAIVRPSALLVWGLPMFRSYARFGVVVQLMAVLLAGIGADALWRSGRVVARAVCIVGILLAIGEYTVAPAAMSRDVLPTTAHRWLMTLPGAAHALDCAPLTQETESVQWLTGNRITVAGGVLDDCLEPDFAEKLAAHGYTHLVVRADAPETQRLLTGGSPRGLRRVMSARDGAVFEVTALRPLIYIEAMNGFSPRETSDAWTWRWMGGDASWTIVNGSGAPAVATLDLELEAFAKSRTLQLLVDGREVATIEAGTARGRYVTPALSISTGAHMLTFHSVEPPVVADTLSHNGDLRPLSFAMGDWQWTVRRNAQ